MSLQCREDRVLYCGDGGILATQTKHLSVAVLAVALSGATLQASPAGQAQPGSGEPSRPLEQQGFQSFYSLDYDSAIAAFQKLRDAEPENASWQNHLANAYLFKQLHLAKALQGNLFGSSNLFFRVKKIQPDPALEKGFRDANQAAIRLCDQRLKQNRKDEEALYACGVAYGARASYQGLIERAKLDSISNARKANVYHSELIRLNPRCYDAYLVPGLYEYVLGSLPGSLKFLLLMVGFSGDKERGIHSIESTAQMGERSKQDAKILLSVIYRREKRYADARRTLEELAQEFPRNYIFPLEVASVNEIAGEDKEAIRGYEQVLVEMRDGKPGFADAPAARIHYELGQLYFKSGNLESAKAHFDQVPGSAGTSPELDKQSDEMRRQIDEALRQKQPG